MRHHIRGQLLIPALLISAISVVILSVLVNVAITTLSSVSRASNSELAFQIAEAGTEYYRWHLAHAPLDFQNGTGQPGPYVIPYFDKNNVQIGTFTLTITSPPVGSTVVTVRSKGMVAVDASAVRTVEVRFAIPSLARYAIAANDTMRFGAGTEVFGPIHSNGGIRFDGLAHNIVTSSQTSYDDPDHSGGNEFGVHTHVNPVDPLPPAAVPNRSDVFIAGRQFPVPAIDFVGLTVDLAQLKASAQSGGRYYGASGGQGYHVVVKTNDTFDLYKVTSLTNAPNNCTDALTQPGWGTWSVNNQTLLGNYIFPANGILFLEDHAWVDGQINGARLTIASGKFPDNATTRTSITVNNNLLYTNYDGSDALALIAQNNINAGLVSADTLRIDAALIAQNGRAGRYYYRPPSGNQNRCSPYHVRQTITLYGLIITNQRYGFAYTDGTGYQTRNIIYDNYFLYSPPPSFPLTSNEYQVISWQEIK